MNAPHPQRAADLDPRHVAAARSVIVELFQILASYREAMVLIGGWVPDLLLPSARPPHSGSIDVDLLLKPSALVGEQYADLIRLIGRRGYRPTEEPFRFSKEVAVGAAEPVSVDVEFLIPKGQHRRRGARLMPAFRAIEADGARLAADSISARRQSRPSSTLPDLDERAFLARDAYERVKVLLRHAVASEEPGATES